MLFPLCEMVQYKLVCGDREALCTHGEIMWQVDRGEDRAEEKISVHASWLAYDFVCMDIDAH